MHQHIEFILYAPVDRQPVQFDQTVADVVALPEIENQSSCSVLDTLQYMLRVDCGTPANRELQSSLEVMSASTSR